MAKYDAKQNFAVNKKDSPRVKEVKQAGQILAETIQAQSAESAEQTLALRKVEEAVFWTQAAIERERNEETKDEPQGKKAA